MLIERFTLGVEVGRVLYWEWNLVIERFKHSVCGTT